MKEWKVYATLDMLPNIHFYQSSNDACGTDRYLGHSLTTFQDTEFCLYERKICDKRFICYSA